MRLNSSNIQKRDKTQKIMKNETNNVQNNSKKQEQIKAKQH